jgi:repressor LexA
MKKSLTAKQKLVLATIQDLKAKLGKAPTLEEIRKALGYSGISSVQRHIKALKKKNYLSSERYQARTLEVLLPEKMTKIPLVGNAPAGAPFLAIENIEAYIPHDTSRLKGDSKDYFFLRAIGDSMDKSNINGKTIDEGDYVLVRKQPSADYGKRVVALIGNDATIKRLIKSDVGISLEPESTNLNNKPILVFDDNFSIQGEVIDVLKRGCE